MSEPSPQLHVFIGTKAQYIKTAPVLRRLDGRGIPYRLIDSGQHAELSGKLRDELGVRGPDLHLGGDRDITSIPQALLWAAKIASQLVSRRRVRDGIFGGSGRGICVVHGDTPSTLLSCLLAKRAGLEVAHLEAGLRSRSLLNPFPEELIRIIVMRFADLLFAPNGEAVANLSRMRGVSGRVVPLPSNTSTDAVVDTVAGTVEPGPVIVTMHRVENLHRPSTVAALVELVERIAKEQPVRFVVHGPTAAVLESRGDDERLRSLGVELVDLVPHGEFVDMLRAAPFVITDGGSIQEECALIGVPTLLWRQRTEWSNGIGENVVLSRFDSDVIEPFVAEPERWRRPPATAGLESPSEQIVDVLVEELAAIGERDRPARRGR